MNDLYPNDIQTGICSVDDEVRGRLVPWLIGAVGNEFNGGMELLVVCLVGE